MDLKELELLGVIAFDGLTRNGLRAHPDGEHLIYTMGNKVVIKNMNSGKQDFLAGHRNFVSAICASPCGRYLASGQMNHHGFKAMVIIWNFEKRNIHASYELHKVRVEDVCFTHRSDYLVSLGGRDDGTIIVWDVQNGQVLCGGFAGKETAGNAITLTRMNACQQGFISAGEGTLKVWRVVPETRKLYGSEVQFGKIRRTTNCVAVDGIDEFAYCGTTTGDIIKIRLNIHEDVESAKLPNMIGCYSRILKRGSKKVNSADGDLYEGGVKCLIYLPEEKMIVGTGGGTVEMIEVPKGSHSTGKLKKLGEPQIITLRTAHVCAAVTSLILYKKEFLLVGTIDSEIYELELSTFRTRLLVTCHMCAIRELVFPRDRSDIFATAGKHDIRIWKLDNQKELLRITVPNFVCSSLCFNATGRIIISAWNDGAIRGFTLRGGELIFAIQTAHTKAVSAIVFVNDDQNFVTGGCDGQVRVWDNKSDLRKLLHIFKEHRGPVTLLRVALDQKDFISTSTDGTCIVWDSKTFSRRFVLMGKTMYLAACFVPSGVQILTCGTDRKIAYWERLDGTLVREIEGSTAGAMNAINISPDGRHFITGSEDCTVRLWEYLNARTVWVGLAHAAQITCCVFTPNDERIVTASADGTIMIWKNPVAAAPTTESNSSLVPDESIKSKPAENVSKQSEPATLTANQDNLES